jgi:hypothetical protein
MSSARAQCTSTGASPSACRPSSMRCTRSGLPAQHRFGQLERRRSGPRSAQPIRPARSQFTGRVQQAQFLDFLVRGQQVAFHAVGKELQRHAGLPRQQATRWPCSCRRWAIQAGSALRSTGSTARSRQNCPARQTRRLGVAASSRGSSTSVTVLSLAAPGLGQLLQRLRTVLAGLARGNADLDQLPVGKQAERAATGQHRAPVEVRAGHGVHAALGATLGPRHGADGVGRLLHQQGSSPCTV